MSSLLFEYPLRAIPTYLADGAPPSRPVVTPFVASELVPTPIFLLLLCVALPHSPAKDDNSPQSCRNTHLHVLIRVKKQKVAIRRGPLTIRSNYGVFAQK